MKEFVLSEGHASLWYERDIHFKLGRSDKSFTRLVRCGIKGILLIVKIEMKINQ